MTFKLVARPLAVEQSRRRPVVVGIQTYDTRRIIYLPTLPSLRLYTLYTKNLTLKWRWRKVFFIDFRAVTLFRWVYERAEKINKYLGVPAILRYFLVEGLRKKCKAQGLGLHTPQEVRQIMAADLRTLQTFLGKVLCCKIKASAALFLGLNRKGHCRPSLVRFFALL